MLFFRRVACVFLFGFLCFSKASAGGVTTLKSMMSLQVDGLARQTLDYSCGAAAVSFLLRNYFGDVMSEKDILADIVLRLSGAELQSRKREGFSMLDLKGAALRLGYMADGVVLPREVVNVLPGPIIILLRRKYINHFAVLKGVSQGRAFLADPSGVIFVYRYILFSMNGRVRR